MRGPDLMTPGRIAAGAALFMLLASPGWSWGQSRLDPAAMEAWRKYEAFFKTLQGTVHRTNTSTVSGKMKSYTIAVRQNAGCAVAVSNWGDGAREHVLLANRGYAAQLQRRPGERDALLRDFAPDPRAVLKLTDKPVAEVVFAELSPHYCHADRPLTAVFADPKFHVERITRVPRDGRELVRVEFATSIEIPGPVRQESRRRGALDLDPALGWCVLAVNEHEEFFRSGTLDHTTEHKTAFTVDPHPSGVGLLRQQSVSMDGFSNRTNKKIGARIENRYEIVENPDVADGEFTLAAFNLPDPIGHPAARRPTPLYPWFAGAAVALGAAALVLRRRLRAPRPDRPPPQTQVP